MSVWWIRVQLRSSRRAQRRGHSPRESSIWKPGYSRSGPHRFQWEITLCLVRRTKSAFSLANLKNVSRSIMSTCGLITARISTTRSPVSIRMYGATQGLSIRARFGANLSLTNPQKCRDNRHVRTSRGTPAGAFSKIAVTSLRWSRQSFGILLSLCPPVL